MIDWRCGGIHVRKRAGTELPSTLVPTRAEAGRGLNAPRPSRDIHKQRCEPCIITCAGYSSGRFWRSVHPSGRSGHQASVLLVQRKRRRFRRRPKRGIDMSDFYTVLGVAHCADNEQIKAAFRRLAKTCHPDLHSGDKRAERRFKEIGSAYETLGNPDNRAMYDLACAEARANARRRFKAAAATMSASFAFTVSSGLLAGFWLIGEGF